MSFSFQLTNVVPATNYVIRNNSRTSGLLRWDTGSPLPAINIILAYKFGADLLSGGPKGNMTTRSSRSWRDIRSEQKTKSLPVLSLAFDEGKMVPVSLARRNEELQSEELHADGDHTASWDEAAPLLDYKGLPLK